MSQRIRCCVSVLSLTIALFVVIPAPSWAAGIGDWQIPVLLTSKAWSWVAKIWPGDSEQARAGRSGTVRGKEGSIIDPNGLSSPGGPAPAPTPGDFDEEGSVIDPNGQH